MWCAIVGRELPAASASPKVSATHCCPMNCCSRKLCANLRTRPSACSQRFRRNTTAEITAGSRCRIQLRCATAFAQRTRSIKASANASRTSCSRSRTRADCLRSAARDTPSRGSGWIRTKISAWSGRSIRRTPGRIGIKTPPRPPDQSAPATGPLMAMAGPVSGPQTALCCPGHRALLRLRVKGACR